MRKTSGFPVLAFLFLIACSGENAGVEISKTAQENFKLLPAESNLVLYCDFSKINKTRFAQEILAEFNKQFSEHADEDYESFKKATGLDPQKDFHNLLLGSTLAEDRRDQRAFIIIKGTFDESRIISYIREQAGQKRNEIPWKEEKIAGKTVYISTEGGSDFSVSFVEDHTLYVGPRKWMENVLTGNISESLNDRPEYIASLVKNIKYGDQMWLALDAKAIAERSGFASDLKRNMPVFERVQSVVFSAKANDELDFNGTLLCDSEESGEVMVDLMKGALAAAKLAVSNERAKVDELNKIKIYQDGNVAVLQGELTDAFFKTLKEHRFYRWNRL
jgi:hypothetical protein